MAAVKGCVDASLCSAIAFGAVVVVGFGASLMRVNAASSMVKSATGLEGCGAVDLMSCWMMMMAGLAGWLIAGAIWCLMRLPPLLLLHTGALVLAVGG